VKINIKIFQTIGVVVMSSCLIAGGFIFFAQTTRAQELLPSYQYEIVEQSADPILEPNQPGFLTLKLKNIGSEPWPLYQLYLSSIYFDGTPDHKSPFATSVWIDQNRILAGSSVDQDSIRPRGTITFNIPIQTVTRKALYQESFKLHLGTTVITGPTIKWLLQVGNELSYQDAMGKQIYIWLSDQRLWVVENNVVMLDTPISSGKSGYNTPKGKFKILNHIDTAYSSKYSLFMDNWMALYNREYGFIGYGLHALPHWKVKQGKRIEGEVVDGRLYTNGKLYEDYMHLGKPMSHGCVRVGIEASKVLYDWAPNNTLVTIA
jgi:hypothetical protein